MNNLIFLYFKYQFPYLLCLIMVFVLPLGLFFEFSTYTLPKVQYAVLFLLFASQYLFFREDRFRKKIEKKVELTLKKEIGRMPSIKDIHSRSNMIVKFRGTSLVIVTLCILVLMLTYQEF